jgi:hypothetical protein
MKYISEARYSRVGIISMLFPEAAPGKSFLIFHVLETINMSARIYCVTNEAESGSQGLGERPFDATGQQ